MANASTKCLVVGSEGLDLVPLVSAEESFLATETIIVPLLQVHLNVFEVWERDSDGHNRARRCYLIRFHYETEAHSTIGEVNPFADHATENAEEDASLTAFHFFRVPFHHLFKLVPGPRLATNVLDIVQTLVQSG